MPFTTARAISSVFLLALVLGFGCSGPTLCEGEGVCLKECNNQADCSSNQTCLNSGTCACFRDQNGAECSDSADCNPDEACNGSCQCVPNSGGLEPTPSP